MVLVVKDGEGLNEYCVCVLWNRSSVGVVVMGKSLREGKKESLWVDGSSKREGVAVRNYMGCVICMV